MRYDDFAVLSFDCYGTLIDWDSGLVAALGPWRSRCGAAPDEDALLSAFAKHETAVQQARPDLPYPGVLAAVLRAIGEDFGTPATADECAAFGASVGRWPPFPDTVPALQGLARKYRLCILSNVDRTSFERSAERLEVAFDAVFTAQDIGAYKPDPRAFRVMLDALAGDGIPAAAVLHVAQSLYHDHAPAQAAGLRSVWIDRRPGGGAAPKAAARYDARFETLAEFAAAAL